MAAGPGILVVSVAMHKEFLRLATSVSSEAKGTVLFRRGDAAQGIFLIRSGRVSVGLDTENTAFPPRILGPGAVVGLPATVAGFPYSLTAEVIDDAELAFVPRPALLSCLQSNPQLCFEVMDLLSSEISGARTALKQVGSIRLSSA